MIKRVFPVIALAVFSAMLGGAIIAPLLPRYVSTMGATGLGLGIIFSSYSISKALVMPLVGRYSDKIGRKWFLATGLFSFSILSMAYIWADSIIALCGIRIIHGFAAGMILPVARAAIGELTPVGQESRWMGRFNVAFFAGMGGGPLLGGVLYDAFTGVNLPFGNGDSGMVAAFGTMGILSLLAFIGILIFLPNIKEKAIQGSRKPSFRAMGRSHTFVALFGQRLTDNMARRAIFTFVPVFGGIVLGLSATQIGLLIAINSILSGTLQAVTGNLVDRWDKRRVVIIAGLAAAVYMGIAPSVNSFAMLMVIMVINGIRGSFSNPAVSGIIVEEGRKYGMATAMATFSFAIAVGEALGPIAAGLVVDFAGGNSTAALYFGAFTFLAGTLLFAWFSKRPDVPEPVAVEAASGNGVPPDEA